MTKTTRHQAPRSRTSTTTWDFRLRPECGWGLRSTLGCCVTSVGSQALGCPWR